MNFSVILLGVMIAMMLFLVPQTSFSSQVSQSPQELYNYHDIIFIGEISDSNIISQRHTEYEIEVVESIKNSNVAELIVAVGKGTNCMESELCMRSSNDTILDIGDTAILYIHHDITQLTISPYSRAIDSDESYVLSDFASPGMFSTYNWIVILAIMIVIILVLVIGKMKKNRS